MLVFFFGIVLGLEIIIVIIPPRIERDAKADCGTRSPKTIVAPTNGAVSSQILAQTIVDNAQIFFFSSDTNSTVHVVSIESVEDIAALEIIADNMSKATRSF